MVEHRLDHTRVVQRPDTSAHAELEPRHAVDLALDELIVGQRAPVPRREHPLDELDERLAEKA